MPTRYWIDYLPKMSENNPELYQLIQQFSKEMRTNKETLDIVREELNVMSLKERSTNQRVNGLENSRRESTNQRVKGLENYKSEGETFKGPRRDRNTPLNEVQQGDYDDVAMRSVKEDCSQFDGKVDPKEFFE